MQVSTRARDLAADAALAQKSFFRLHRVQLWLILLAAAIGLVPLAFGGPLNWAGLIAAGFFGASVLIRVLRMNLRDEDRWYGSRHNAELAKSLCFRFAFGGEGYERELDEETALRRLAEAGGRLSEAIVRPREGGRRDYSEASDEMLERRRLPLAEARALYAQERIADQEVWFTDRAFRNRVLARRYLFFTVTAEVLGLLFGILVAVRSAPEGLVGLMSAIAATAIAWSQLRQHSVLAESYAAQASVLRRFGRELELLDDADWPAFVTRVENSFHSEQDAWTGFMGHGR